MVTEYEAIVRLAKDLAAQEENPRMAAAYRRMATIYERKVGEQRSHAHV